MCGQCQTIAIDLKKQSSVLKINSNGMMRARKINQDTADPMFTPELGEVLYRAVLKILFKKNVGWFMLFCSKIQLFIGVIIIFALQL